MSGNKAPRYPLYNICMELMWYPLSKISEFKKYYFIIEINTDSGVFTDN